MYDRKITDDAVSKLGWKCFQENKVVDSGKTSEQMKS